MKNSTPIPITKKTFSQPFAVVGLIIEKDNKFLLVQEAFTEPGSWSQPAGWVDLKEDILDAAKREGKEETGLDVELTGLLGIYSFTKIEKNIPRHPVKFIFTAKVVSGDIKFDKNEIMDAQWFSLDQIKAIKNDLRDLDIIDEIQDYLDNKIYPLEIVKPIYYYEA